jgi:hypothetical protein
MGEWVWEVMSTKEGEANFPRRKEDALEPLSPKLWPNAREQTEKGEEKRGRWRGALVGRWDDPMWGRVQMMGKAEEGWGDGKREREGKRRWKGGHIFPWWGNRGSGWIERWLKRNLDGGAKSHRLPTSRGSKEKTRGGANRTVEREGEGSALSSQSQVKLYRIWRMNTETNAAIQTQERGVRNGSKRFDMGRKGKKIAREEVTRVAVGG